VRTHVRIAANLTDSAAAEALADAGVALAIMDLAAARGDAERRPRFAADGRAVGCAVAGEGRLLIQIGDEAARIDVNSAGVPILQALLVGLNETPEHALALAEAIFDYRDRDDIRKPNGAERAEYLAAGLAWTPKNAPFDTVEELGQVLGMTPALLAKMQPHVGVHSGLAGIDAALASRELRNLLRLGVEGSSGTFGSFPDLDPDHPLPAMFNTPSLQRVFAVSVEAAGASGARFVREAIVETGAGLPSGHVVRGWQRGTARSVMPPGELPPC
jgi:general secretion pathway protein K